MQMPFWCLRYAIASEFARPKNFESCAYHRNEFTLLIISRSIAMTAADVGEMAYALAACREMLLECLDGAGYINYSDIYYR